MNSTIYGKIADLLLFGVNFNSNDKLLIRISPDQRPAALEVMKKAYRMGAAYVGIQASDNYEMRYAIEGSENNPFFPSYLEAMYKETTQPGWKMIGIFSEADCDALDGLETGRAQSFVQAYYKSREVYTKAIMSNQIPWTLTYLPSVQMAQKAFPHLDAEAALKKYWEAIIPIMGLDQDDPVQFWKDEMLLSSRRNKVMNSLDAEYLHFTGPGTDLKVYLCKEAYWIGGFDVSLDGQKFMANIPTAEIFTTPDYRRTTGRVALTRPFVMHHNMGPIPTDAWFEFSEGRVTDYGAASGKESLDAIFAMDERNRYIGEVALVDPRAPIAKTGLTFFNGLYDENAACHLALGRAYPFTLKNPSNFTEKDYPEIGLNTATLHEDMMIGGSDVNVVAVLPDSSRVDIIKDGAFVLGE